MQRPLPYIKTSTSISQNLATSSSSSANKRPTQSALNDSDQTDLDSIVPKLSKLSDSIDQLNDQANLKEQFIGRISKKFDDTAAQSQRPITENITELSEQLTKEKIAAIKAKKKAQQRKQVSSGVELDDELLTTTGQSSGQGRQAAQRDERHSNTDSSSAIGFITGLAGTGDESDAIMREIFKREAVCKNRFSVLQSGGKQFEKDINAFLQLIKAKEEGAAEANHLQNGSSQQMQQSQSQQMSQNQKARQLGYNRFDQERYAAKDETGGFSIDTKLTYQPSGGALSLTPNPNATPNPTLDTQRTLLSQQSSQLTQQNKNIITSSSQSSQGAKTAGSSTQSQKRTSTKPIIIIPNISSSLITMFNCLDILQDLKFFFCFFFDQDF